MLILPSCNKGWVWATYLEGGYIKSYYDGKERFMDVVVQDKRILPYLKDRYEADYLVFLNELDIRVKRDGVPMPGEQKPRQIKVAFLSLYRHCRKRLQILRRKNDLRAKSLCPSLLTTVRGCPHRSWNQL